MVDRRVPSLAIAVVAGLSALCVPVLGSDVHHLALWRLEHDFVAWADLEETGVRQGVPVATRGGSQEGFLSRLDALEGEIRSLDRQDATSLRRKIEAVRSRIVSWKEPTAAGQDGARSARFPVGGEPAEIRAVLPSSDCPTAGLLSTETLFWATTDSPGDEFAGRSVWFEASGLLAGWYRIHTGGSTVDTVVTVYDSCGGEALGANDDGLGLQSELVVHKSEASQMVVQVQVAAHEGRQDLFLTLEGTGSGGIAGVVRDESTGELIRWVRIELYMSDGSDAGSANTNDSGAYSFNGLEPGTYFVLTDDTDDYLDELWDGIPCEAGCVVTSGDPIAVDQDMVIGIDFDLSPGASISGTVLEIGGGLVTDGRIRLFGSAGQEIDDQWLSDLGRYRFRGLVAGTYFVQTDLDGYQNEIWDDIPCVDSCDPLTGTPIVLEEAEVATGFDFDVETLSTISGRLTDAQTGLPIQNGSVELRRDTGYPWITAFTDVFGNWTSQGLPPGTYFVYSDLYSRYRNEIYDDIPCDRYCDYEEGTPIALEIEEDVVGIDMALDPLGAISGVVTDEGTAGPIAGVRVEAWMGDGTLAESGYSSALGYYEMPDLYPGIYYVVTDELGPFIDELFDDISCFRGPLVGCDPQTGTPIPIDLAVRQNGIDFALARGGVLIGQLSDEATRQPIVDSEVRVYESNGAQVGEEQTDAGGHYAVGGLPTDLYFLRTVSHTYMDELWDGFDCEEGCDPLTGTPIPLERGGLVDNLDFELVLQGGISGVVTDAGAPIPGVVLHAWDNQGEVIAGEVTDANGFYQIDLTSGFYFLSTDAPGTLINKLWVDVACPFGPAIDGQCDPLDGDQITVVGAEPVQTGFDFDLNDLLFEDGFESGDPSEWSEFVN